MEDNYRIKKISNLNSKKEYYISVYGEIFSKRDDLFVLNKLYININGYKTFKNLLVHRLVAIHFIPNSNNYPCVLHKDNNKLNNNINNLRWGTAKENAIDISKSLILSGENHYNAKTKEKNVIEIIDILNKNKKTIKEISEIFNVSYNTVIEIKNGLKWKHLKSRIHNNVLSRKNTVITKDIASKVTVLLEEGKSIKEICLKLGISRTAIENIKKKNNRIILDNNDFILKIREKFNIGKKIRIKSIKNHKGYFISENGEIFSCFNNKIKKLRFKSSMSKDKKLSYCRVLLNKKTLKVHRLVAEHFYKNKPTNYHKMIVRHLDGNPENNHIDNLRYGTMLENSIDNIYHKKNINKLNKKQVLEIRKKLKNNIPQRKIAKQYNVSQNTINRINRNKSYRFW